MKICAHCPAKAVGGRPGPGGLVFFCAAHRGAVKAEVEAAAAVPPVVGERVHVRHGGLDKIGVVVKAARVRAHVEVPIHGGKAHKVIVRPLADLRKVVG